MKILIQHTQKLDDRSKQVVNLGKECRTKAYRLYDPVSKRIHVSKDVTFEESKACPWDHSKEEEEQISIFTMENDDATSEEGSQNNSGDSDQSDADSVTPQSHSSSQSGGTSSNTPTDGETSAL